MLTLKDEHKLLSLSKAAYSFRIFSTPPLNPCRGGNWLWINVPAFSNMRNIDTRDDKSEKSTTARRHEGCRDGDWWPPRLPLLLIYFPSLRRSVIIPYWVVAQVESSEELATSQNWQLERTQVGFQDKTRRKVNRLTIQPLPLAFETHTHAQCCRNIKVSIQFSCRQWMRFNGFVWKKLTRKT